MPLPKLLKSPILACPHAFTTRHAGVSSGIFSSLNFGNPSDLLRDERDPASNIRANLDLVKHEIGCEGRQTVEVHQVHGASCHLVRPGKPTHPTPHDTRADAIITDDPSRLLVIRVADCAPVLLASTDGAIVAAAHAGWRGVISGIIPNTVRAMQDLGARRISAAVGPCISVDHFEIGPEVAAEFERVFGPDTPTLRCPPSCRPFADLKLAIKTQLESAGVERIEVLAHCTFRDHDLFFSHRRDRGRTGRMIGVIGPANNPAR